MSFTIQDFIKIGICRDVNELKNPHSCVAINLGGGRKKIGNSNNIDLPDWDADEDDIPYKNNEVDIIWMIHSLEHFKYPIEVLKECQRVLRDRGVVNIVVPYYNSNLNAQELDHKHSFSEETFPALFRQKKYYDKGIEDFEWEFVINFNLIIGVHERNMCLYVQLIKEKL